VSDDVEGGVKRAEVWLGFCVLGDAVMIGRGNRVALFGLFFFFLFG